MPFHRTILVAVATLFTAAMSSGAIARCCGWGVTAPVVYSGGCGGCGGLSYAATYATPLAVAPITVGCGGCGVPTAAAVFVEPVAPMPVVYGGWGGGCGGCGSSYGYGGGYGSGYGYGYGAASYAPASPLYVVNQGPEYGGPGVMVPYRHYGPPMGYASHSAYPYLYRPHHYFGSRYAYGMHPYMRPHYFGPRFYGPGWHRPLGMRG
jgi:hypothetical protein